MAGRRHKIIGLLVIAMDVAAGIIGIKAESVQNKGKHLDLFLFECKHPVHAAFKLGLAAALLLVLAHLIASLIGGCTCICSKEDYSRSSANKHMAFITLILSWIVLIVAFAMLMIGAMSNSKSSVSCGFEHRHFLLTGGILCFIHGLFCAAYYVSAVAI